MITLSTNTYMIRKCQYNHVVLTRCNDANFPVDLLNMSHVQ